MNEVLAALIAAGIIDQETADMLARQLDPALARAWGETVIERAAQAGLSAQQGRLLDFLRAHGFQPTPAQWTGFWRVEDDLLWRSLADAFTSVATQQQAARAVTRIRDLTFELPSVDADEWVNALYMSAEPGGIPMLDQVSRGEVQEIFTRWLRGGLGNPEAGEGGLLYLVDALAPTFGPVRAGRIAATETTRIFVEANRHANDDDPLITQYRVLTAYDELVCDICGPLHGRLRDKAERTYQHPTLGAIAGPPFHVNCRCNENEETDQSAAIPLRVRGPGGN